MGLISCARISVAESIGWIEIRTFPPKSLRGKGVGSVALRTNLYMACSRAANYTSWIVKKSSRHRRSTRESSTFASVLSYHSVTKSSSSQTRLRSEVMSIDGTSLCRSPCLGLGLWLITGYSHMQEAINPSKLISVKATSIMSPTHTCWMG